MDTFVEQLVKRKKTSRYYVNLILIVLVALSVPAICVVLAELLQRAYLIYIGFFLLLFCIYGAWYFISSLKIDYEYQLLSSTLRVDKIIAKRKRKPVLKVDVKDFETLFKYSDKELSKHKLSKFYYVGEIDYSEDNYVALFTSAAKGRSALVFSPKEKLLDAMRPYLNREIVKNIFSK